ncbi:MAG: hypothetical protein HUU28_08465 [Planctomycetaceae bacterium]|nr:hypothetical protein [Planctomycetaceae bacterium]
MDQRRASSASFATALFVVLSLVLAACRAAEPISVEQRWLRGADDENKPSGHYNNQSIGGAEGTFEQVLRYEVWEPHSTVYLLSHERDPATGAWVESWVDFDVGRKVLQGSAATLNDIFVLSDAGQAEFVIDRFRVTPPAGGYRAVRPRGGPTRYELIGDRFLPPLEREKATIERWEIARVEGPVVAIAAEPNARSLLAFVRRETGVSQALQIDIASGEATVLADSSRFPLLASAGSVVKSNHSRHGFIVVQLLNAGRWYVPHKLVFLDRDRDGDFDDVRLLTDDEFEANGYLDSAQLLDD